MPILRLAMAVAATAALSLSLVTVQASWDQSTGGHKALFGKVAASASDYFEVATKGARISVGIRKATRFQAMSAAAESDGFQPGDAVWASVSGSAKHEIGKQVRYDTAPFAVPNSVATFHGGFEASTRHTVTIRLRDNAQLTFRVNGQTTYRENGNNVPKPTYHQGDRVTIQAVELTDASNLARRVAVNTRS